VPSMPLSTATAGLGSEPAAAGAPSAVHIRSVHFGLLTIVYTQHLFGAVATRFSSW
jgi:hypothetical protein